MRRTYTWGIQLDVSSKCRFSQSLIKSRTIVTHCHKNPPWFRQANGFLQLFSCIYINSNYFLASNHLSLLLQKGVIKSIMITLITHLHVFNTSHKEIFCSLGATNLYHSVVNASKKYGNILLKSINKASISVIQSCDSHSVVLSLNRKASRKHTQFII